MQLRRHKDIVAIRPSGLSPVAFHSKTLQVASVTEDTWNAMAPISWDNGFDSSMLPDEIPNYLEAYQELEQWNLEVENNPAPLQKALTVSSLTLNVTQLCNLHCHYCAAGGDGTYGDPTAQISIEKTLPQIKFFIDKLNPGQNFHVTFLGGEPLLYPKALQAIGEFTAQYAKHLGLTSSFTIITNGTLISNQTLDLIAPLRANIILSIDGAPEVQDKSRPQKTGKASSELVAKGLEILAARKSEFPQITAHSVFNRLNTDISEAYEFFLTLGFDEYEFTFDLNETDSQLNQKFISEMSLIAEKAYNKGGEKSLKEIKIFRQYFNSFDSQRIIENHCGSGKTLLSLDSKNRIYACPLDVNYRNSAVGQDTSIDSEKLSSLQKSFIDLNACHSCWARHLCGGGCLFAHQRSTGDKHKKHISYCVRTRSLIAITVGYYEKIRTSEEEKYEKEKTH